MTSREKIEHMLHKVREKARISPTGFFYVDCNPFVDIEGNRGVPDEAPVLLSQLEQINLLKKFEKDNLLYSVEFEKDHKGAWVALMNLDKDSDVNPYDNNGEVNKSKQTTEVVVQGGILAINEKTGYVRLNTVEKTLNHTGWEFKIILTLIKNDNHQATYSELIGGEDTKPRRRPLSFNIRNLKETLCILPKNKAKNMDIIKNIKNYGYKLIT